MLFSFLYAKKNVILQNICRVGQGRWPQSEFFPIFPLSRTAVKNGFMKKILFLHGFFSSGSCGIAQALGRYFGDRAEVVAPDLPRYPEDAIRLIRSVIDRERPDVLMGNSCGAFYLQMVAPLVGIPALLGNPHFEMSQFLRQRIGVHRYKWPRRDGMQEFEIDQPLVEAFEQMERVQFRCCSLYYSDKVWGIFGEQDPVAHYESEFRKHYSNVFHFPGSHTPSEQETAAYHAPLLERLMETCAPRQERYFRHFKGGLYRYERSAYDSETCERMVVYQALYGEHAYWVRPETMFFENIEREGQIIPRFTEIENNIR